MKLIKRNQQQTRVHNRQLVLQTIYDQFETSRVDVARQTGLTRTTVSDLVSELMADGYVEETGQGQSNGGKRPTLLKFIDDKRCMISVDLASHEFQGAVVNLRGQIINKVSLRVGESKGEDALKLVFELIDKLLEQAIMPIIGIGIGSPGLIDPISGTIDYAVNLDWRDLPLAKLIRERYDLPVHVANNSQAAAFAETTFGAHRDLPNMIVIKIGRGIAARIVINGEPFFGDGPYAGEIGHVVVKENGDLCPCGKHGCLETVASSRVILKRAQNIAINNPSSILNRLADEPCNITLDIVRQASLQGDPQVNQLIDEVTGYLGMAIANLVCAINIKQVMIAGIITELGDVLINSLQRQLAQHALASLAEETHIETSQLGKDIVIQGISALLIQRELGIY
jgi:N-acetylglucosamine repressor